MLPCPVSFTQQNVSEAHSWWTPASVSPYRSPLGEETTLLDCRWAFEQLPVSGNKMLWTVLSMCLVPMCLHFCWSEIDRGRSEDGGVWVLVDLTTFPKCLNPCHSPQEEGAFSLLLYPPISPIVSPSFQLLAPRLFPELPPKTFLPEKFRLLPTRHF